MKNLSLAERMHELREVLEKRVTLYDVFNRVAPCEVLVGGSYALVYQCPAYVEMEREVNDYDFIIFPRDEEASYEIKAFIEDLDNLVDIHLNRGYSNNLSLHLGTCNGKAVNVILSTTLWKNREVEEPGFETVANVIKVKKQWCKLGISKDRRKDLLDIVAYRQYLSEQKNS